MQGALALTGIRCLARVPATRTPSTPGDVRVAVRASAVAVIASVVNADQPRVVLRLMALHAQTRVGGWQDQVIAPAPRAAQRHARRPAGKRRAGTVLRVAVAAFGTLGHRHAGDAQAGCGASHRAAVGRTIADVAFDRGTSTARLFGADAARHLGRPPNALAPTVVLETTTGRNGAATLGVGEFGSPCATARSKQSRCFLR